MRISVQSLVGNVIRKRDPLETFYFVQNDLKGELPKPLLNTFKVIADIHTHNTRGSAQHKLSLPKVRTQAYGINSIIYRSTGIWNILASEFPNDKFHELSKPICKKLITRYLINKYE